MKPKKITKATVKSFIKKNLDKIYINEKSRFDGMTDCVESRNSGFLKPSSAEYCHENNMGLTGVWFVGSSRDYFQPYEDETFKGIRVSNCCGSWIVATKKSEVKK